MSNAKRLDELAPGATVPLTFNFTSDFEEAGLEAFAISGTPSIAISVDNSLRPNPDPSITLEVVGSPAVSGKVVTQMVTGGVNGVDYMVRCSVGVDSTPAARLYKTSIVPVRNQ